MGGGNTVTLNDEWHCNGTGVSSRFEGECRAINLEAVFEPSSNVPVHIHKNNGEIFLIIDGYLIETVTGKKISKGEFLIIPENTAHGFNAPDGAVIRVIFKDKL
jgi:quercetin dioxygenase-like cupin family protein